MGKALAILGSPRKDGNAAKLLQIAAHAAQQSGYQVDEINLYAQQIAWCRGCMACKKTGICVIDDDIAGIRERLQNCDLVMIASPTYFANVSAPVKNLFDRLVGAVMDDNHSAAPKPKLSPKQQYILLATCNTPFPFDRLAGQSSGCIKNMHEFFHVSGMKCKGKVVFAGTRGKETVPGHIVKKVENLF